ncbi:hypothetical protein E4U22_002968 [Claviceps purpurea]|nr:hypothetical protein E4U22_002968 [Claviceps purpurea]
MHPPDRSLYLKVEGPFRRMTAGKDLVILSKNSIIFPKLVPSLIPLTPKKALLDPGTSAGAGRTSRTIVYLCCYFEFVGFEFVGFEFVGFEFVGFEFVDFGSVDFVDLAAAAAARAPGKRLS